MTRTNSMLMQVEHKKSFNPRPGPVTVFISFLKLALPNFDHYAGNEYIYTGLGKQIFLE